MSVFGGSALFLQSHGIADVTAAVKEDVATAMFVMLNHFPLAGVLTLAAVLLVTIFFVPASDSGSLVVDDLTSGGKLDSPTPQQVFWAVMEGIIACVLLIGGGLATLQTASVSTGLSFAVVLLIGVYALSVGFSQELFVETAVERAVRSAKDEHRVLEAVSSAVQNGGAADASSAPVRSS